MAPGKRYQPEQVLNLVRQIEMAVANGKTTVQACKETEILEQTYFRWPWFSGATVTENQSAVGPQAGKHVIVIPKCSYFKELMESTETAFKVWTRYPTTESSYLGLKTMPNPDKGA
jgi:hypothetical protein